LDRRNAEENHQQTRQQQSREQPHSPRITEQSRYDEGYDLGKRAWSFYDGDHIHDDVTKQGFRDGYYQRQRKQFATEDY
jgi:hypothetical protein